MEDGPEGGGMSGASERELEGGLSLCTLRTGEDVFGIETGEVREALNRCEVRAVPLAPKFVAGVLAYRGDVLLAVSFRALLGMPPDHRANCAVVLQDEANEELFALLVDELLDVVQVDGSAWEPNPATFDEARSRLFSGLYRTAGAPLVRLGPKQVQPSWLIGRGSETNRTGERR
jgi:purine-binding chemotaxis protein CheW